MANMSCCMFQNTLSDLQDCVSELHEYPTLSEAEYEALRDMIEECKDLIELSVNAKEEELEEDE